MSQSARCGVCNIEYDENCQHLSGMFDWSVKECNGAVCIFPFLRDEAVPVELYSLTVTGSFDWNDNLYEQSISGIFSLSESNQALRFEVEKPDEALKSILEEKTQVNIHISEAMEVVDLGAVIEVDPIYINSECAPCVVRYLYSKLYGCVVFEVFIPHTQEDQPIESVVLIAEIVQNEKHRLHKSVCGIITPWKPLVIRVTSEELFESGFQIARPAQLRLGVSTTYSHAMCSDTFCLFRNFPLLSESLARQSIARILRALMYAFLKWGTSVINSGIADFLESYCWDPGSLTELDLASAIANAYTGPIGRFEQFFQEKTVTCQDCTGNWKTSRTIAVLVFGKGVMSIDEYNKEEQFIGPPSKCYQVDHKVTAKNLITSWRPFGTITAQSAMDLFQIDTELFYFVYDKRHTKLNALLADAFPIYMRRNMALIETDDDILYVQARTATDLPDGEIKVLHDVQGSDNAESVQKTEVFIVSKSPELRVTWNWKRAGGCVVLAPNHMEVAHGKKATAVPSNNGATTYREEIPPSHWNDTVISK